MRVIVPGERVVLTNVLVPRRYLLADGRVGRRYGTFASNVFRSLNSGGWRSAVFWLTGDRPELHRNGRSVVNDWLLRGGWPP